MRCEAFHFLGGQVWGAVGVRCEAFDLLGAQVLRCVRREGRVKGPEEGTGQARGLNAII